MPKLFDEFDLDINKLNDDLEMYSDDTGGGSGGPACNTYNTCVTCIPLPTFRTCCCESTC